MSARGQFRWNGFLQPKKGNTASELEDAWAADAAHGRFAIADGASESSYSGEWANCLTAAFIEKSLFQAPGGWGDWLPPIQGSWKAKMPATPESISWFAEEKLLDGAFATFLGLEFTVAPNERTFQAVAVGDSCLFRIHEDTLVKSFPLERSAEFGTRPTLLGSRQNVVGKPVPEKRLTGNFLPGDIFFLMTDALAAWFIAEAEGGRHPWRDLNEIRSLPTPESIFEHWVQSQRASGSLKNDDVSLIVIEAI